MRALVQWSNAAARDWEESSSQSWRSLAKRPDPAQLPPQARVPDATPGWVSCLNAQGCLFEGYDHYAVTARPDDGIDVTVWNDETAGERYAWVATLLPLQPDPLLRGAINTRQSSVLYAESAAKRARFAEQENTEVRTWAEFSPPPAVATRHGLLLPDALHAQHQQSRSEHGWREWVEGLDPSELDENGRVRAQRPQGRFLPNTATKTYYQTNTDLATGLHVGDFEKSLNPTNPASATTLAATITQDDPNYAFIFTTISNEPNDADWPNGLYRCQLDVTVATTPDHNYGFRSGLVGDAQIGHFARVTSTLSADSQTWAQSEAAFTGTGLKLASQTVDPTAGSAGDRWECLLAAGRDAMTAATLTLRVGHADSFADGPWVAAAAGTSLLYRPRPMIRNI